MAIYYLNAQIIGRSAGRTATGAAAYRAGERIVDERTGQTYDYTRRRGDIQAEILAPADAPEWVRDRSQLWNQVEMAERRADAQVAREIVVAIPVELDREQQQELVRHYVQEQFVSRGMAADVAIHRNPGNPHAHIMLTMREVGPDGLSAKKNREWNKPEQLERWREEWARESNRALERAGREERIDHRSLEAQGVERLPQVHLGPHAAALERQGIATELGEHNRQVAEHNAIVIDPERARKEREVLRVEHAAEERFDARTRAGWHPEEARAMASLEAQAGGRQLSQAEVTQIRENCWQSTAEINNELRAMKDEEVRLSQVDYALQQQSETLRDLQRHETPTAAIRRWFSDDAKQQYREAKHWAESARERVRNLGTPTAITLERDRTALQERMKQVPDMNARLSMLSGLLDVVNKGLRGFSREHDRDHDDLLHELRRRVREHQQDRGYDRGR